MTAINFDWTTTDHMGYGIAGRGMVDALTALGVDVYPEEPSGPWCEAAVFFTPPCHIGRWKRDQRKVSFTMWETEHVPITFTENLREFTTVVVPSQQNVRLFQERHDDVRYCPLGIDPVAWRYRPRHTIGNHFEFLVQGAGDRKGIDIALSAFAKAFPERHYDVEPWLTVKNLSSNLTSVPKRVHIVTGRLPLDGLVRLYADAHCFIAPSRGEGWGMMPLQAMAQGCPTILSDAHGHAEFSRFGIPIDCTHSKAGFFLYGTAGTWWEPTEDQIVDAMREVYSNYEHHRLRAEHAAKLIHDEYTWENAALALMEIVGESEVMADPGPWTDSHARLFLLRVSRKPGPCLIGNVTYNFEPGKDHWAPADVRRVMAEAGYLDESCLVDQTGRLDVVAG